MRKKVMVNRINISISMQKADLDFIDKYCYDNSIERSRFLKDASFDYIKRKKLNEIN